MQRVGIPISRRIGGDVFESFQALDRTIKKNDGIRSFSIKTNSCYDSDAPVTEGTQTHIRITNNFHDINQISESYLRCKWKIKGTVGNNITYANGGTPLKLFVGWKNSNECIRQLEVENNNVDCEYLQTESMKEGCAYSAYMPDEKKKNRRYTHSRWEDVEMGVPGVCGTYIDLDTAIDTTVNNTLRNASGSEFSFETIIPITDLLAFQAFDEWPGNLGDIVLKLYFSRQSMVYAFCDPQKVNEAKSFWKRGNDAANNSITSWGAEDIAHKIPYTRGFVQNGQQSMQLRTVDGNDINNDAYGAQTITITELKLENLYCDVYGYNVTQECKRNVAALFTPDHPMIIPAQHLDVKQMPKLNCTGAYDADFTYALHNVTDFIVVWPRRNSDQTCFYNPMLQSLQLRVDGKLFPTHKLENTWDYRFYTMMMRASDLDNYYEADKSYSQSLLTKITDHQWDVKYCCPYDISTFLCTFQAERNTAGYCFDGIETGNQAVNIALSYKCENGQTWFDQNHSTAPQIWFCRDTYWTCDATNGLKYHKTGTPPLYASAED